jgi:hypothetical protein
VPEVEKVKDIEEICFAEMGADGEMNRVTEAVNLKLS